MARVRWTGALLAVALVASACSSDDTGDEAVVDDRPDGAGTVEEYLDEVRRIEDRRTETVAAVVGALNAAYQTRQRFFEVFEEVIERESISSALDEARELEPPPELADAHEAWLTSLQDSIAFAGPARDAIARDDLAQLALAVANFSSSFTAFLSELPAEMCDAVAPERLPQPQGLPGVDSEAFPEGRALCESPEGLPGGEYAARLREVVEVMPVEIGPRISGLQVAFTDDETIAYLQAIQPDVERLFAEAITELDGLLPPADLRADHDAVRAFFADLLDIAERITDAADEGDLARLPSLFAESARPGEELEATLSMDGREIVAPLLLIS